MNSITCRPSHPLRRLIVAASLCVFALPAGAATLTVGAASSGCNHITIQAAVNAAQANAGADTIRVSRSAAWTAQAINITTDDELTVVGGYATCGSATPDGTQTVISGSGGAAAPVIVIRGNGTIFLRNLVIQDGDNPNGQGGGIDWRSGGILDIRDSAVINNIAGYGGGIYALGSSTISEVVVGDNVTIGFNTARFNGGGLLAAGLEFSVLGENTSVLFNEALGVSGDTGYGGGALVVSIDGLSSYLYLSAAGIGGVGVVYGNKAKHGGGVAVIGGVETARRARLLVFTRYANAPVRINGNSATERGGALYLRPDGDATAGQADADAKLWYAFITDNQAPAGGAIYLDSDPYGPIGLVGYWFSSAYINTLPDELPAGGLPCPDAAPCGAISDNLAESTNGAIIQYNEAGNFNGRRLLIQANQGARLIDMPGSDTRSLFLFNSLVTGNAMTQELIRDPGMEYGRMDFRHVTIADNAIGSPDVIASNYGVTIVNSLIWQPGRQPLAAGTEFLNSSYVISNDSSNVGGIVAAPRFVDPANGDYRLRAGSRGVDYAVIDTSAYALESRETLDGSAHTINVPNAGAGNPGIADVGAYERPALQPLVLNADFDSDLNLWEGLSDSFWDATQNASGSAGSGSVRIPLIVSPEGVGELPLQAGRSQCIHLPGPGIYTLNGYGRVVPSSNPPLTSNRARLVWELRTNGGASGCEDGSPSQSGTLNLASTSTWATAPAPAQIQLSTVSWTVNASLTVKLDVSGSPINPPNAWFDGIRVDVISDSIFRNGFD